jgi:hypothetical protein
MSSSTSWVVTCTTKHGLLLHHGEEFLIVQVRTIPVYDEMVAFFVFFHWEVDVTMRVYQVHVSVFIHMLNQVVAF